MIQIDPGADASALEAWRAIAILAIGGLTTILGVIGKAALAQRKAATVPSQPTNGGRHSWHEERGEFCNRLETVENESNRQRDWRHDEYAKQMQSVLSRLDKVETIQELQQRGKA
jgi:hypothetical protein